MAMQVVIIGLGQFGMGLIRALSQMGVEMIAVDSDDKRVQLASSWVSEALCLDATDEEAMAGLQPNKRDVCVCATGDQSKEVGIICTALLRQMGAKRIISRANDDLHARILRLVGADEIVNPEWDFGERYAPRILSENILGEMLLDSDIAISEFEAPTIMHNKKLKELDIQRKHSITLVAVREGATGKIQKPGPEDEIHPGDVLIAAAQRGAVQKMLQEIDPSSSPS
ncbi:MAG: TrkA family potassium uptake protein [Oligoflexales bacterium]